jgi:hypothetical protein
MEILIKFNKKGFDCENGLIVLTEFGEELLGNRQNICIALSELLKSLVPANKKVKKIPILPSEVTLRLQLYDKNSKEKDGLICSYCGKKHEWQYSCGEEGPGEIITFFAKDPDTDMICHNCIYWKT